MNALVVALVLIVLIRILLVERELAMGGVRV